MDAGFQVSDEDYASSLRLTSQPAFMCVNEHNQVEIRMLLEALKGIQAPK
jgi:hypothetical protein